MKTTNLIPNRDFKSDDFKSSPTLQRRLCFNVICFVFTGNDYCVIVGFPVEVTVKTIEVFSTKFATPVINHKEMLLLVHLKTEIFAMCWH